MNLTNYGKTMQIKTNKYDVGIIVGRFQVPSLHEAHRELIQSVIEKHPRTVIFLGVSPVPTSRNNPLDFETRRRMIQDEFPEVEILYIKDTKNDDVWSKNLDERIGDIVGPGKSVVLYGGKDSFIPYYTGKFPTLELIPSVFISGTQIREEISKRSKNSYDFRAGIIWAVNNKYPVCYPTVDIVIFNKEMDKVLLVRKPNDPDWYFVGGFADVGSSSYEEDAKREVKEEVNIEVSDLTYQTSLLSTDWRYSKEIDKIKTIIFTAIYLRGDIKANDDVIEAKWFPKNEVTLNLSPNHRAIWNIV